MTIQTFPGVMWLPSPKANALSGAPSFTTSSLVIDAADESAAFMVRVPKTGSISKVLWATRTVTTGATITVRGETWDETTSPAQPSNTLYHANFTGTSVIASSDDNVAVLTSLSAAVSVTQGDKLAIVIKNPNTSFANMQIAAFGDDVGDFPYCMLNTGVSPAFSWASINNCAPVLGLEYNDGSYEPIPGCYPCHAFTATTFANSSTPDEIGLRFKLPFPFRLAGWWAWLDADGDFNVNLYDSDGVTKRAGTPFAVDKDSRRAAAQDIQLHQFASTFDCLANTFYRLVIEPSSATNLTINDFTVNAAAAMDAMDGGQNFHLTSAKNPAAEGDWTNTTTRRPFMGIGIKGLDDATGSSAGGLIF